MTNKLQLAAVAMLTSLSISFAYADAKSDMKANREAVNEACSVEATTAGCSGQKVGKGLIKCVQSYKKSNKEFKVSDGCKAAIEKMHESRKAKKAAKDS